MKNTEVLADWSGLPSIQKMGVLSSERIRGKEVFAFEYEESWLKSGFAQEIDPDLRLYAGPQYTRGDKPNFGLFLDSSPDRWGRMLMDRREVLTAKQEGRRAHVLSELDYLLGVNDETRMGALRFRANPDGVFLASHPNINVPPFTSIRTLEEASLQIESDDFFQDSQARKWLQILMAPGSSLGGARPKANVRAPDGNLWIAKFPSRADDFNSGAWEFILNQLARKLEIRVAEVSARKLSQKHHTFLSKRFDRQLSNRIHFASAMTLLGYKDGHDHQAGGSYLEIVEFIERYGAAPAEDIRELWKRVVFSVLVSNTDDHLRNHGFLLTPKGWRLSPAYDLNPNPTPYGLSLNINENDNSLDIDLCLEVAPYFRWKQKEGIDFLARAKDIIQEWPEYAKELNIAQAEQVMMEQAFHLSR